jgi:hypothetical protein
MASSFPQFSPRNKVRAARTGLANGIGQRTKDYWPKHAVGESRHNRLNPLFSSNLVMKNSNHDDPLHFELDDEVGEKKTQWNGCAIEVTARLIPRFLWSTASIDVFLDGRCILRTGGQLGFTGSSWAVFHHARSLHKVELSWERAIGHAFPYRLTIDDDEVAASLVFVENLAFFVIPAALVVGSIAGAAFLLALL